MLVPHVCNLALRCATVENIGIQLVQSSEDNLKTQKFKNYIWQNWDLHLRSVLNNVPVCRLSSNCYTIAFLY